MKILVYIWRNIRRNKVRSLLTILSVGFSLALMTVLYGFMASQDTMKATAKLTHRIVVMNIQGFTGSVPISAVEQVARTKGVAAAIPLAWSPSLQPIPCRRLMFIPSTKLPRNN